jgi:hypothetical protein
VASLAAFVPDTILEQDGGIVGQRVTKWKSRAKSYEVETWFIDYN